MVGVVASLALVAATANAQSVAPEKPFGFGVSAGLSVPTGDFGNAAKAGFNFSGLVEYRPPTMPVSFRGEGTYQQFGSKFGKGSYKVITGLANVVYPFPASGVVTPYATGGLGLASVPAGSKREVKFAYNLGVGAQFQLTNVTTFAELTWLGIPVSGGALNQIPLRVGVRF
jgi:opacity protein-like surface antigen